MNTFGTPRRHLAQCGSTNDLAREWACDPQDPAPSGALVTADFQTRGRGQRGRQWQAGFGQSALMSFVYRPQAADVGRLGFVVAAAVADALADMFGLAPRIKWPNDILLDGRKAAGILVEVTPPAPNNGGARGEPSVGALLAAPSSPLLRAGGAVLGLGVNVNQERFVGAEEYIYPPTSLRLALGRQVDVEAVIQSIVQSLSDTERRWREEGFLPILEQCRARLAVGAAVRQGPQQGELVGLNSEGGAHVRLPDGTFALWTTVN